MQWRRMGEADSGEVKRLADTVHKAYPEEEKVFVERLVLYRAGCHCLIWNGRLVGYCIAHPWVLGLAPALNCLLERIPAEADTLYIHDLALAVHARGRNAARTQIAALVELAIMEGLPSLSLTAVNGSAGFWERNGFFPIQKAVGLASYGGDALSMVRWLS